MNRAFIILTVTQIGISTCEIKDSLIFLLMLIYLSSDHMTLSQKISDRKGLPGPYIFFSEFQCGTSNVFQIFKFYSCSNSVIKTSRLVSTLLKLQCNDDIPCMDTLNYFPHI